MAHHQAKIVSYDTKAGKLNCHVFGELEGAKAVIMTVHDLGCNSSSWHHFINHPSMEEVTKRVVWLHVNLPGQEDDAAELPKDYKFPSMDEMADALEEICATVHSPVIGLGEGAGANIMARLALKGTKQLHGAVLIHVTSSQAGFLESMKDKAINWKLLGGMNPTAEQYLVLHRFGDFSHANDADAVKVIVEEFHKSLNSKINAINLRGYIDSFAHRTDLSHSMSALKTPILIMTGEKASHNHTVHHFHNVTIKDVSDRKLVEFIQVDGIANVVEGAPERLAESMQFFMQGCGVLGGAPLPHVSSSDHGGQTMEQLDKSDL